MEPKIIAVTGGNRGIGLEICRQLAELGHHVILCSRDLANGISAAQTIAGKVEARQLDMADEASMAAFAQGLANDFARLDVLINNAGLISSSVGTPTVTLAEMQRLFTTNAFGPLMLTQALLPLLRKSPAAGIINISSEMGKMSALGNGYAAYRLSKASLNAITISMARELQADGIVVNAMCPGWVKTDMGGANAPGTVEQGADTAVWLATTDKVPTGKFFSDRKEISW